MHPVFADDRRNERMKIGPAAGANIDPSGFAAAATPHAGLGPFDLAEDCAGFFEHQLAGIGQRHALGVRRNSGVPNSFSNWRICELNGGWLMPSRLATRVQFNSSATATK